MRTDIRESLTQSDPVGFFLGVLLVVMVLVILYIVLQIVRRDE